MISPETVIFAIQAALQLYGASRRAYVDATRGRALVLPLPRAPGVNYDSAFVWFTQNPDGQAVRGRLARIDRLLPGTTAEARAELVELFLALRAEADPGWSDGSAARGQFSGEQLAALLEIRQWAEYEPDEPVSALQQVGGTLVNLAVDYFATTPGAVSPERPAGRALLAFLRAIDSTDFARTPVTDLAGSLMLAMLDAVAETPELAGGGEKEQALITSVSRTLADSVKENLAADAPTLERRDAADWLRLATRALVKGGADAVLGNPVLFLGVRPGAESNVVAQVGRSVADLLIGADRLTFRRLLSGDGLTAVVRASLDAVAKNPELLKVGNQGVKNLLVALAADVAAVEQPLGPDLFPELARSVLQRSAENLDLLWGRAAAAPEQHLLLTASRTLLTVLAAPPPAGARWTPRFTRAQIVAVADAVFDEVIDNPAWLVRRAGAAAPPLGAAVEAMLGALRQLDGERVSAEAGLAVLRAGLSAVAAQRAFLDALPGGAGTPAIGAALQTIIAELFAPDADAEVLWRVARNSLFPALVAAALAELTRVPVDPAALAALQAATRAVAAGQVEATAAAYAADLRHRLAA